MPDKESGHAPTRLEGFIMTSQIVCFRLIETRCCRMLLCSINARHYNYCPECGKRIYPKVKDWVIAETREAILSLPDKVSRQIEGS